MSPDYRLPITNVPRGTIEKLETYIKILEKWNQTINLVSVKSISEVWERHVNDSMQLFPLVPTTTKSLIDLGSGAGFPGMVLAIMGVKNVTLIEADSRKCSFLQEVARITDISVSIINQRIENVEPWAVEVVTSRALASLDKLIEYAYPFIKGRGVMLCLKGEKVNAEIQQAQEHWNFSFKLIPSKTYCHGTILHVEKVSKKEKSEAS